MIEATGKRARRKERNNSNRLETIHRCDHCDRDCHSRIGLYSHKKRCPSLTAGTRMLYPWSTNDRRRPTIQLTLLWLCKRWANSKQSFPPLNVWNHFVFLFLIDSVQQIARYYSKGFCPLWTEHTLWARIHKNFITITNIHVWT